MQNAAEPRTCDSVAPQKLHFGGIEGEPLLGGNGPEFRRSHSCMTGLKTADASPSHTHKAEPCSSLRLHASAREVG